MPFELVQGARGYEFGPAHFPSVTLLPQFADHIEEDLRSGLWLLLLVAIWSRPDRVAILTLGETCQRLSTDRQLRCAARPFDDHRENRRWCRTIEEMVSSPIWVLLRDGRQVDELVGVRSLEELLTFVDRHAG